jgi:membrane dipeptidase
MPFFDSHLDLACLAENGRDMAAPIETCGGPFQPAGLTFPSLKDGDVRAFLGTIFTEADGNDAVKYPAGDAEAAHQAGLRQLAWYQRWHREGLISLQASSEPFSPTSCLRASAPPPPSCLLLMECADPIRTPEELHWWADRGVLCIGMAWARGSRYAAGNAQPSCDSKHGLTDLGRALVHEIDARGLVHDASHLSDRAFSELMDLAEGDIVATHSNCRSLLTLEGQGGAPSQRHLTEDQIIQILKRGGVIGLNLYASFIKPGLKEGERPAICDAIAHIEHICDIAGHRCCVGLGSDLDGGFAADRLPLGIDKPADFQKLADALAKHNWSDEEIEGFVWRNWASFWERAVKGIAERATDAAPPTAA